MKKIGIGIVILGLIAGGALKFLEIGPFAVDDVKEKKVEVLPSTFTDMDPLLIPVFQGEKVVLTYQIVFKIETAGKDNQAIVRKMLPRLHDAFLKDLYIYIPRILKKRKKLDLAIVKNRLQAVAEKSTGPGIVKNILIQSVIDKAG